MRYWIGWGFIGISVSLILGAIVLISMEGIGHAALYLRAMIIVPVALWYGIKQVQGAKRIRIEGKIDGYLRK